MDFNKCMCKQVSSREWYTEAVSKQSNPAAPFDQGFHVLLNLAAGGNFCGQPDNNTVFPQRLYVDYITVHVEST